MITFKRIFSIKNIHIFVICLIVVCIPLYLIPLASCITLWLITGIIIAVKYRRETVKQGIDAGLIAGIALYLVFVAGVFYSPDKASAVFDIQVKLSLFLLLPLMFVLRSFYRRYAHIILWVFVFANIATALYCLGHAFTLSLSFEEGRLIFDPYVPGIYEDLNTKKPTYFSYTQLSVFRHPAYFSMYLTTCFFILIYFIRNKIRLTEKRLLNSIAFSLMFAFILLMIYLLESKAAYLTLLLLLFVYALAYIVRQKKWIAGIILVLLVMVAGFFAYKNNSRFYYLNAALKNNSGFTETIKQRNYKVLIDTYGIDRIPIWMISGEIIGDHLLYGVGSGDVSASLMQKYKEYGLENLQKNKYNCHNQYLETMVAVGLPGFMVFLFWLLLPLFRKRYYTSEGFLMLAFSGILIINFFFESVLNTIAGVIFVAFFYNFFYFVMYTGKEGNKNNLLNPDEQKIS